jgi:amidase
MAHTPLPIINVLSVPTGSPSFEEQRSALLSSFSEKVPVGYHIPRHYTTDPPKNVTSIPRDCGILTPEELKITENYDATALAEAIAARKYTAVAVATAFSKRAIICHQISCCLTEWMPELALKQAKALDDHLARTGKTVGPLHGVPVSIKQHIPLAQTSSDMGFLATRVNNTEDALLVDILRKLGAVFYVKTNRKFELFVHQWSTEHRLKNHLEPQGIMHLETDGYLGRTLNPHNINLSSGGSSGGEAALVALRGSILGVGTDIGGSIRAPAGFVGIYGFKPTARTLPMRDCVYGPFPAELNILGSIGPMCHSLRDVDLFMHAILGQEPHIRDPLVVPIPWTGLSTNIGVSSSRRLKVGIMMDEGVVRPQPPVVRALLQAKEVLAASPLIEVKPYRGYKVDEGTTLARKIYTQGGSKGIADLCEASGEPVHFLSEVGPETTQAKDAYGVATYRYLRDKYRTEFSDDWAAQDVDVILSPVYPGPAPPHDTATGFYCNYTSLWNLVDCPGIVFPTSVRAGAKGSEQYSSSKAWNSLDAHMRKLWEENDYEGAPVALQLVARKHYDNFLIGAVEVLRPVLDLA